MMQQHFHPMSSAAQGPRMIHTSASSSSYHPELSPVASPVDASSSSSGVYMLSSRNRAQPNPAHYAPMLFAPESQIYKSF
jgi:hypothetical protein